MTDTSTTLSSTPGPSEPRQSMPEPPAGTVWKLNFNPSSDDALLWLYKRSRITGRSTGMSVSCEGLYRDGRRCYRLKISTASIDQIVEATIVAAHELIREHKATPKTAAAMEAKAAQVSKRLGIEVEIRSR